MGNIGITFDTSEFIGKSAAFQARLGIAKHKALGIIADEILRLSQKEVPFVTGELMKSGTSQPHGDEWIVGYNKPYAAYMHEGHWFDGSHVIKQYSNNRKDHYLEDPIKINKEILREYFGNKLRAELMV